MGQSAPKAPSFGVVDRIEDDDILSGSSGNLRSFEQRLGDTNIALRSGHLKHRWPL